MPRPLFNAGERLKRAQRRAHPVAAGVTLAGRRMKQPRIFALCRFGGRAEKEETTKRTLKPNPTGAERFPRKRGRAPGRRGRRGRPNPHKQNAPQRSAEERQIYDDAWFERASAAKPGGNGFVLPASLASAFIFSSVYSFYISFTKYKFGFYKASIFPASQLRQGCDRVSGQHEGDGRLFRDLLVTVMVCGLRCRCSLPSARRLFRTAFFLPIPLSLSSFVFNWMLQKLRPFNYFLADILFLVAEGLAGDKPWAMIVIVVSVWSLWALRRSVLNACRRPQDMSRPARGRSRGWRTSCASSCRTCARRLSSPAFGRSCTR